MSGERLVLVGAGTLFGLAFGYSLFIDFIPTLYGGYNDQRLLLCVFLVLLSAGCMLQAWHRDRLIDDFSAIWPFYPFLAILGANVAIASNNPEFVDSAFYLLYFLSIAIVGQEASRSGKLVLLITILVCALAVSCFLYAAMTINVYLFAINDGFSRLGSIIPWGFVNIRYWSHIATWALPVLPVAVLIGPLQNNKLWRIGIAFTMAIWWWLIFMSSSRGSMIGLLLGYLVTCFLFGRAALPWLKNSLKYLSLGLVAWVVLSVALPNMIFEDVHVRGLKMHSSGRLPLWEEALEMSLMNFPFGMGPQSWLTHEVITDAYASSPKFGHPHNMYLMFAAEYGWISVLGLAFLGVVAIKRLLLRAGSFTASGPCARHTALIAVTASVAAALVHAGVSAVLIAPASMTVGLLLLALFWALLQSASASNRRNGVLGPKNFRRVIELGVIAGFLVFGLFWMHQVLQYRQAMASDLPYYTERLKLGHLPRFWFHGNFPRRPELMKPLSPSD